MSKKTIYFYITIVCFAITSNCFADSDMPYKEGELLVRFSPKANGSLKTKAEHNQILSSINAGEIKHSYKRIQGLTLVKLPKNSKVADALSKLKGKGEFLYVEPNYKIKLLSTTPNDPCFVYQWGLHNGMTGHDIHAPEAWDIIHDAPNIIVAVTDTGICTHSDLSQNMWVNQAELNGAPNVDDDGNGYQDDKYGWDFTGEDPGDKDPNDYLNENGMYYGHSTHVAGIIGAHGNDGTGVTGVCWNVKIMNLKIFPDSGDAFIADAIDAIEYAIDKGAKVINASWGIGSNYSQSLKDEIEDADAAGVLFIAATGNSGSDNDASHDYPASYDCSNIISVMATDNTDGITYYTNYGATTVDLAAPGSNILSCLPGDNYGNRSGTSMAAPHVAGACALVWAAHPNLTHLQVKDVIMQSVDPLASLNGLCVTGGRLNLFNAVTATIPPIYLTKTDNAPADGVKPNDRLTYTINYNDAEQTLTNVVLTDTLPAEVLHTDVAPSGNGDYNSITHEVTWTIGTLAPGDSCSVTVTVTVGNTMPSAGHLTNTAKIRADDVNEISAVRQTPYYYMVHNVDQNRWYHTIQSAIINLTTVNGDEIVVYPGTYTEAVNFGSKVLTLRSTNPNDPLIVAQTIIEGSGSAAVTFNNNNSTINGFTITSADDDDDGIYCTGSGSDPNIKNCVIRDNFYGIYCDSSSAPTIANCIIKDNATGIQCESTGQAKIINNLIVNNGTEDSGSGIVLSYIAADTVIRNNTICGNYYGIYLYGYDEPNISNCIIRGNTSDMDYADIPFDTVNYCCLGESYEGQDNIAADPCFINASAGDYRLKFLSPCVDAGNPNFTPGENETDVYNSYRLLDGDRDGTAVIDIGASELFLQDFNADRIVNFLDFSMFANVWQTSWTGNNSNDMYDINNDNQIDTKDLNLFTASWLNGTAGQQFAAAEPQTIQPLLYLTYDANTPPDANGEVIVYVHTAVSLVSMEMRASVVGDANIISAMSTADCNQYGWDWQYSDDPNIDDSNGLVQITSATPNVVDANTTVGYFKLRPDSGQINVAVSAGSIAYDANNEPVTFSADPLTIYYIAAEPNQGGGSPVVYLTYDGNTTPDPNTEITIYVHTDVPLSSMLLYASIAGDANITSAMSTADCNQYGWDPEWSGDPYIDDVNGLVGISGGKWGTVDANTTVGYFKFIYNGGQVDVAITTGSYVYDANSQSAEFSTDPLIFGGESMQGGQQQSMMMSMQSQSESVETFDVNGTLDWLDDLWQNDESIRNSINANDWQEFLNAIKSSQ